MKIEAKSKVYLMYCSSRTAIRALGYGGVFHVKVLELFPAIGTPNEDLEFLHSLTAEALERGDLIFCEYTPYDGDDSEINSEMIRATLSNLLQIEVPPHEYVTNPDGAIFTMAFQPLCKGEVFLLFDPCCDADDRVRSRMPATVTVPTGMMEEDKPPPLARPANVSGFEVMVIFCCETD